MVFFKLGAIFVELKEGTDMDIFVTTHAVFHSLQKLKSLSCLSGWQSDMCNQKLRGAFQMKNRIFVVLSILFQMWFFLSWVQFSLN